MDVLRDIMDWLRRYLTPWVLLGAVGTALVFLTVTILILLASRSAPAPKGVPTAALYVIPAPTDTLPVPTVVLLPTATPTSEVRPPPPAGVIAVGSYVEVTGTGTVGLRMRDNPGLSGETKFLGMDAEVFKITDGPREVDGYTWWHLVAPFDEARQGWAVANYLSATTNNP
jgi:hypothetical protein